MESRQMLFTYEDYKQLPDDGYRYEVLNGFLVREPSPRPMHQIVSSNLFVILRQFALEHHLGPVLAAPIDVLLSEINVLEPDIVYLLREQADLMTEDNICGAPALVVEVLSPSTRHRDRTVKRGIYERFGVKEYWLVDPDDKTIVVLSLTENRYVLAGRFTTGDTLTSPLFPGLSIDVAGVFRNPFLYS